MAQIPFSDRERKCPICGEAFILRSEEWAYKRMSGNRTKYFCSWHCLQEFVQDHSGTVAVERWKNLIELIKRGMTVSEIVRTTGIEKSKVKYWMERVAREGDK